MSHQRKNIYAEYEQPSCRNQYAYHKPKKHAIHPRRLIPIEIREDLFATNHPSGNPTSSLTSHTNLTSPEVNDDIFDPEEDIIENLLNLDKTKDLPPYYDNQSGGNPTPISKTQTSLLLLSHHTLSSSKKVDYLGFNPPLLITSLFHKEVPGLGALLSFSSEIEEKFYNPEILTSKRVHTSLLPKLSHRGTKTFKVTKILERARWRFFHALLLPKKSFLGCSVKRISDKSTKNKAKHDKTEHGMEEREKTKLNRSQSPRKSKSTPKSQQSNPRQADIREKDEKSSQNDKTGHGVEKRGKAKVKSKPKSTKVKVKVNPEKSTIEAGADTEEYLMGPPESI
ncbi:hypothetical protein Tco_1526041 [Tanacetum coccineum]